MCGLLIAYSTKSPIDRQRFDRARDSMFHRGPDAGDSVFLQQDSLALGHRRLSIIDLSQAANQPMQSGDLWVVFNGEIYNWNELRCELVRQGCTFRTNSDTEVLLHGYRIWGQDICHHLLGMYAFGIWDARANSLFLARDHVGQKPLYYYAASGVFIAASEIKGIRELLGNPFTMRKESLLDDLMFDFVPEPNTWYREVKCVLPGHFMQVSPRDGGYGVSERQYWTFTPAVDPDPISEGEALESMGQEIGFAVKSHLAADVEVGAFLSAGTDSSCIVATAARATSEPLSTFSIGFGSPDGDELPVARQTAKMYATVHKEESVLERDYQRGTGYALEVFDEPFTDNSLVPTERVSEFAARDVKVVLSGDGGDEVFGGYDFGWFVSPYLSRIEPRLSLITNLRLRRLAQRECDRLTFCLLGKQWWSQRDNFFRRLAPKESALKYLGPEFAAELADYDPKWIHRRHNIPELDPFRRAQWLRLKTSLPARMLAKVDRCSMRHSLETRAPLLSHKLVEMMFDLPTAVKNPESDWFKGLLRKWLVDKVPQDVIDASKRGFNVPDHWRAAEPRHIASERLLERSMGSGILAPAAMSRLKRKPRTLWKFLQVEKALELNYF
ncbi:MAG: asparagine synthase (glutamine-hydrolyzing) [Gammaproteobacteria bacterium]